MSLFFFFQAEDGIRDLVRSRGLGDVYKRQMYGRAMIWSEVSQRYMESFELARTERRHYIPPGFIAKALDKYPGELPPLKLNHLLNMTDETGTVSYTHLRAHETVLDLVCRLLLATKH